MSLQPTSLRVEHRRGAASVDNNSIAIIIADANKLKSMPASERPNEASLNEVRLALAESIESVLSQDSDAVTPTQILSNDGK